MKSLLAKAFKAIDSSIFLFVFFLVIISSCGRNNQQNTPDGLIGEEKMMHLLIEFHKADAYVALKFDTSQKFNSEQIKQAILTKQGVTQEQFKKTVDYYSHNTLKLDSMYDKILSKLSEMRAEQAPTTSKINPKQ